MAGTRISRTEIVPREEYLEGTSDGALKMAEELFDILKKNGGARISVTKPYGITITMPGAYAPNEE